jgi:hypothetical protein
MRALTERRQGLRHRSESTLKCARFRLVCAAGFAYGVLVSPPLIAWSISR